MIEVSRNGFPPQVNLDQTRQLNVGVLGYGYWGPKLVRNFRDLPESKLAMVAELRPDRIQECNKLYPEVCVTRDYHDLFTDDVDAVVIATPVYTHYKFAKEALLAGKHVLVEKPITSNSQQAEELIQIAEDNNLTLMVGHTFEYNPAVEAVHEVIQTGELGQVYYLDAARVNLGLLQPDINVMWDLGPHDISLICYILNATPIKVSARGGSYINKSKTLHEVVYMVITFDNDVIANIRLSWLDPVKQRRLTVVGSQKMLVYDDIADDKVIIYDKGVEVKPYSVTEEEFHASYRHGEETVYPLQWREPLQQECQHFLDAIQVGKPARSDGRSGLRVLRVLETAQRSLLNGGEELTIHY
ncbi:MAG: Gfo/Idh/MocA family oxidoreductase [Ardenticatenaceae bacterium]|nr:Gfo/Idh/MocA family oxidoreductase [Ardenticatenaceae bacterium]